MIRITALMSSLLLVGCSAAPLNMDAAHIEIVIEKPAENCQFLGEIVGSQGNWLTGDFTSNANLVVGARNKLRNEAQKLGGNVVYMQDRSNTNAFSSLGTTNTTAVGKVYKCL